MADFQDLLIELGSEELPPKALRPLSDALREQLLAGLEQAGLKHGEVHSYATPRRLAVLVEQLQAAQAERHSERRGPALQAAFDGDGNATKAAQGFARSCGVEVEQLQQLETDKGSWLVHRSVTPGQQTTDLVPAILQQALSKLPIPRPMRWGDRDAMFVRPVHWVVLLFGDHVIDAELLALKAGRHTHGHRFHHPQALYLENPRAYAPLLESEGHVMVDWQQRREAIRAQVAATADGAGGHAVMDGALLDEVCGLVEWPTALRGSFDEKFLEIPSEVLISSMQGHQKYFPVTDGNGRLLPCFVTVSNLESRDPSQVVAGNERVIRPRLQDAAFFWGQDRKRTLHDRLEGLKQVVFQRQLGSLFDKSERVAGLTEVLAVQFGVEAGFGARAAMLSKCDLLTDMVKEFPELQGTMGRYYALNDGERADVADALQDQYLPRFAGDSLPSGPIGQALAIADKLDTLVGIFGIGKPPSGAKDPFGLRRAALGVVRSVVENGLPVDLQETLQQAVAGYPEGSLSTDTAEQVYAFIMERLRAYYLDRGAQHDEFEAVLALKPSSPVDFARRLQAVRAFRELDAAASLAAANKRIGNILRKSEDRRKATLDPALFVDAEESALYQQAQASGVRTAELLRDGDYSAVLEHLAGLREVVDAFFDKVMVMAEDPALRANRLALLKHTRALFLEVADISKLQG